VCVCLEVGGTHDASAHVQFSGVCCLRGSSGERSTRGLDVGGRGLKRKPTGRGCSHDVSVFRTS
jgi:hypothetical protein